MSHLNYNYRIIKKHSNSNSYSNLSAFIFKKSFSSPKYSKKRNNYKKLNINGKSQKEYNINSNLNENYYDAIIIGSGMGGLATATQLASKNQKVIVLEKYIIPGGSAGFYERDGYTFDVGSSMMFGFGKEGTTNLITKALEAVNKEIMTFPDPTQIHYHLPKSQNHENGLEVLVWRKYEEFIDELVSKFPHEEKGIKLFYNECWKIFNALNSLELKSLEEPRYLLEQFIKNPSACIQLASRVATNTGHIAKKYIKDEELLRFIDIECYCWSTVNANMTPIINAGMVFCDRHYGGINYPKGGVGKIAKALTEGLIEKGGIIQYKANVTEIIIQKDDNNKNRAIGVKLSNGKILKGKVIISNATRWDTFEKLIDKDNIPESEKLYKKRFKKAPSFLTLHLGIISEVIPKGCHCHHIILEDWNKMEDVHGTLFVSIPSLLDSSIAPVNHHIFHAFTPDYYNNWKDLSFDMYKKRKLEVSNLIINRLENVFPGLKDAIEFKEIGTPKTHRKFLNRDEGTYGPIPSRIPLGMLSMPFNKTDINGLYCVGDSTFPGQGVNAVVFSGIGCAHRVLCDLGVEPSFPLLDYAFYQFLSNIRNSA